MQPEHTVNMVKHPDSITDRVLRSIKEHDSVAAGYPLLVAVSGGPDSVCLLHVLSELQPELGISLHVAHLDHQLRGDDSRADARYVRELAGEFNLPVTIDEYDVKEYQSTHHLTLEEAARAVRYTFLSNVARVIGARQIAVGHTLDDHIETILMHIIRGTGTRGLRGLLPVTRLNLKPEIVSLTVVRPLLNISRMETADYCSRHNLYPRLDASNLSLKPLRNRLRHELLPLLNSYNPQIAGALLRTARITGDEVEFLDAECARIWHSLAREDNSAIIFSKKELMALHPALMRNLLRLAIEKLLGNLKDIENRHIEEIINMLTRPAGRTINLPGGLIFTVDYDRYLLGPGAETLVPYPVLDCEYRVKIPGQTLLPGARIEASIISRQEMKSSGSDHDAYLDMDKTGDNLIVRHRQPGDRFYPLGMGQTKKLGEFFIDSKIPAAYRDRIPVICSDKQIVWVIGSRIDDRVKITGVTDHVLHLKYRYST